MTLPPGPNLPPIAQTLAWALRPLPFLEGCRERYGDLFTLRLAQMGTFVFVSRPDYIKQIFTAESGLLLSGRGNRLLRPLLGAHSVILLDGAEHMRQRKLLLPPMHGERMHAYAEIMRSVTEDEIDRMPLNAPFAIHPYMQAITLRVIMRAVFGLDESARARELAAMLVELAEPPPAIMAFLPAVQLDLPGSPFRTFLRRKERVDRELYTIIAERRRAPDLAERKDILSLLLMARDEDGQPMTDEELHDELLTMLIAGHETTATSLSWAFERVLAEPRVARKLDAELAPLRSSGGRIDAAALQKLEYLDAVIKETLRVRPILPIVVRVTTAPYAIGGYEIPAGATIAPCIYLTHLRPDIYPEPKRFLPERFVGAKVDPYAWLPFGGGIRRCLGMAFALYEMKIILGTALSRAYLRLASAEPAKVARRSITLVPAGGTKVVLAEREARV